MPKAQFSEDQYEDQLLHELTCVFGTGQVHYKPSRSYEKHLGYDLALDSAILRTLGGIRVNDPRIARGLSIPRSVHLPSRFASLFVQCKVPFKVTKRVPKTGKYWDKWGGWYFKIKLIDSSSATPRAQLETLVKLESITARNALVRYATPCYYSYPEEAQHKYNNTVSSNTHYQSPSRLRRHDIYTYRYPVAPGIGFSEPEELNSSDLYLDLVELLSKRSEYSSTVSSYVLHAWKLIRTSELVNGIEDQDSIAANNILGSMASELIRANGQKIKAVKVLAKGLAIKRILKERGINWTLVYSE